MLKISVVESPNQRRLVLEGKLIPPWTAELESVCEEARENLGARELVVDLKDVSVIGQKGEDLLAVLLNEGVKFRCCGVFAKHVLRQLARRARAQLDHT